MIAGLLTKFQQNIKQLEQSMVKIGTDEDDYEMRHALQVKQKETNNMATNLQREITEYGDVSVAFNQ